MSLGSKSSGDTYDHLFQGIGMVIGGGVITLFVWPFVWLFKRKSEYKWEIAAVIGLTLDLLVAIAQISQ